MATQYRLDILTAAGVKLAEVTDFLALSYQRRVNAPGLLSFTLPGDHPVLSDIEHNSQVIVYRRNPEMGLAAWTPDFYGLYRGQRRQHTDHDLFVAACPGVLTMLAWRIIAWKAGVTNRSRFDDKPAETIMKTLVQYNAGASATTANGRIRDGVIEGITVAADGGFGNVISKGCAYENLLEALQEIAAIGGGDFDLVKTGAATWQFRWYTGQRGTDRTDSVLFALERGNMAAPEYTHDRVDERTVCIVAGQGEESDRAVEVRTGPDYAADNDIETFVEASDLTTTAGLQSRGDTELEESRARQQFEFGVLQTPGCFYGVHYTLGDLVKARYGPVSLTQKIVGISVSVDKKGVEGIDVELEAV